MKIRFTSLLPVCLGLFLAASAHAQIISTLNSPVYGTGSSNGTYGWGETFVVPTGASTNVTSFTMDLPYATGQLINGYLSLYNGSAFSPATALWGGTVQSTGDLITFIVGNLTLNPTQTYVIWNQATGGNAFGDAVTNNTNAYPAGGAVFWNGTTVSDLTANYDLLFSITFGAPSPVPEPATYAGAGLLLCGLLAAVQQRRRKAALTVAV